MTKVMDLMENMDNGRPAGPWLGLSWQYQADQLPLPSAPVSLLSKDNVSWMKILTAFIQRKSLPGFLSLPFSTTLLAFVTFPAATCFWKWM